MNENRKKRKTKEEPEIYFNILRYHMDDDQYNLAREFKRVIIKAMDMYPRETMISIAGRVGTSSRTLYRVIKEWNIVSPRAQALAENKKKIPERKSKYGF